MNDNIFPVCFGTFFSVLVGQVSTDNYGWLELVKGISASGVLAITFYWIMQRFEKRLDEAFNDYKELSGKVIDLLDKEKD